MSCFPRHAGRACETTNAQLALTVLLMVTAYIYFALYFYHLIGALLELRTLPHQDHQITSLQVCLQVKPASLTVPCIYAEEGSLYNNIMRRPSGVQHTLVPETKSRYVWLAFEDARRLA